MNIDPAQEFFVEQADVLATLAHHDGLIIVDFDETLYLCNSTEDFLNAVMPAYVAALLLRVLDFLSPWRWTGGARTRDVWRLRMVMLLMPWTLRRWQLVCARLGPQHANQPLLRALQGRAFVVASIGFAPVIKPLLAAMGCGDIPLIACGLGVAARIGGKALLIETKLGAQKLGAAMFITDSIEDAEVLRRCALPCLTRWEDAKFRRAFAQIYLPGDYLAYVKRPSVPAVLRVLVTDDLVWWLLMSMTWHAPGVMFIAGVGLLFFSLWSVYEIGYFENDVCAQKFEADPVITAEFLSFETTHFEAKAWASALLLGGFGVAALQPVSMLAGEIKWLVLLLGLRALYYIYNRIDKQARVWLYLILQCFRSLALIVVMPLGAVGIIAGVAQILARWQAYFVYRRAKGAKWRDTPTRAVQLAMLLAGLGFMALARPKLGNLGWPALEFILWSGFLARQEILSALHGIRRRKSPPRNTAS
jgi:hypothetical protein